MIIDEIIEIIAPKARPRHARKREKEDEYSRKGTCYRVKVTPKHALLRSTANGDDTARLFARPPQIKSGNHENNRPTADDLDDAFWSRTEIFQAMEFSDNPHHFVLIANRS